MKRGLIVIATLFALTACSGQQVKETAQWTAGAALLTAISIAESLDDDDHGRSGPYDGNPVFEETAPDLFRNAPPPCEICVKHREEQRQEALLEAAEEYRTAQRRAELNAALDAYMAPATDAESEQRSVVIAPVDRAVPQNVVERLDAVVAEAPSED